MASSRGTTAREAWHVHYRPRPVSSMPPRSADTSDGEALGAAPSEKSLGYQAVADFNH